MFYPGKNWAFIKIVLSSQCHPLKSNINKSKKWQADRNEGVNTFRIQFPSYMGDYLFK